MQYELKTIKDIYDKIPFERVEACMKELTIAIQQAQATRGLLEAVEESVSGEDAKIFNQNNVRFPEVLTWKDDGKGEVACNISVNGEPQLTVKSTVNHESI